MEIVRLPKIITDQMQLSGILPAGETWVITNSQIDTANMFDVILIWNYMN